MSDEVRVLLLLNLETAVMDKQAFANFPFESGVLMREWKGPVFPVGTSVSIGEDVEIKVESISVEPGKNRMFIELDPFDERASHLWNRDKAQDQFFSDLQSEGWVVCPD